MDELATFSVDSLMVPEFDTIPSGESVRVARRRMEAETRRSLIVVDADRPVGVLEWRRIMRESDVPADAPVDDYMVREFPLLRRGMSVGEAQTQLAEVDIDRIPVVDENGFLIGEVPRTSLSKFETTAGAAASTEEAPPQDPLLLNREFGDTSTGSTDPVLTDAYEEATAGPEISAGMTAYGSGGSKLGEIDQIITESTGKASAFTVKHGLLSKKHKKIPMDAIDHVEGDRVVLAIDQAEFKILRDEEDQGY